jgi:hypothetical protein
MLEKYCNKCKETKLISEFVKTKYTACGYVSNCKSCRNAYSKQRRENDYDKVRKTEKESHKKNRLKQLYGLTKEQYENKLIKQNYSCAICGTHVSKLKRALAVDHNHYTKVVRGLLCGKCNVGLGHFNDDAFLLKKALKYLEKKYR